MLVKRSIVERWYQTDSWVYRNFSFLFKNPLWSKQVPAGFSVCPYFWLSLFSFFIFKPFFVAPIHYGIRPILRLFGKPAAAIDGLCRKLLTKIIGDSSKFEVPGISIFATLLLTALVTCVGVLLTFGVIKLVALYAYLQGFSAGIFAFWSGLSFIVMWITLGIHKGVTNTDCKTMNYLWVWLVLFLVSCSIFVPTEIISIITSFASGIGIIAKSVGVVIWKGICYCGTGIAIGATWIGKMFMFLLNWKLWAFLVCPLVVITVIGWLGDKVLSFLDRKQKDNLLQVNPQELYAQYRESWISLFIRILMASSYWKNGDIFENLPHHKKKACCLLKYSLYRAAFEKMWKDKLDILQVKYPTTKWNELKNTLRYQNTKIRFSELEEALVDKYDVFNFDADSFGFAIYEVINSPPWKNEIELLAESYRKQDERKKERREARKHSWAHMTCLKFTTTLDNGASSVGRGLKKLCKLVWWVICEVGTFFAYMWTLLKAKKQGACPYILFKSSTDTDTLTNDPK